MLALFITTCGYSQQVWHQVNFNPPGESHFGAICPIDENLVYLMLEQGMFYKSSDGGMNWIENNTGISENFFDLVFFDANLGFAVGTNGTILKSIDGGTSWDIIPSGTTEDLFSMAMISLNDIWVVGHHGVILHSTDGGNTWVLNNSLSTEKLNSVKFNGNTGYIAGNNATLLYTSDYGTTWTPVSFTTNEDFFSLSVTDNNTQFLSGDVTGNNGYYNYQGFRAYKTTDNLNWTNYIAVENGLIKSNLHFVNDNVGFLFSSAVMMCDCSDMSIHRTIDGGQTWELSFCGVGGSDTMEGGYSDLASFGDQIVYALNKDHLFKTTNAGAGWQEGECDGVFQVKKFEANLFSIYPNPSQGNEINIKFATSHFDDFSVKIIDMRGKCVFFVKENRNDPINISGLENGFYFMKILKENTVIGVEKLIKSN